MPENIFENDVCKTVKFIFNFELNLNKYTTIAIHEKELEIVFCTWQLFCDGHNMFIMAVQNGRNIWIWKRGLQNDGHIVLAWTPCGRD